MTPLHPTNLIAVPVPEDAYEIHFGNHCLGFKSKFEHERDTNGWCIISLGLWAKNKYTIIGTATKDTIDFDTEPWVINHNAVDISGIKEINDKKFRSLLTANDVLFENPYDEKVNSNPEIRCSMVRAINRIAYQEKWQTAQSNLVKKLVILEKI